MIEVSPWWLLAAAAPILVMGQWLVRTVRPLARFNIPAPVVGGLLVAACVLAANVTGVSTVILVAETDAPWWTWIGMTEVQWARRPKQDLHMPLMLAFFTCVGLNASWPLVRQGGRPLVVFLGLATVLAIVQNGVGLGMAAAMGTPPELGLLCGSISMTGGHGNAFTFGQFFEEAGMADAKLIGAAAATFGLVAGGLVGGPVAGFLIRWRRLHGPPSATSGEAVARAAHHTGFFGELRALWRGGRRVLVHILIVLACMKIGAWVSYGVMSTGLKFPVQIGALLTGIAVRNALDFAGRPLDSGVISLVGSVTLSLFLAIAMSSLKLAQLLSTGGPMLAILGVQVVVMALFAALVTFTLMGRSYDAAVIAGGHCGFGLGATPNAVANMDAITARHGPSPKAFLIVTITGGFLIDLTNAANITAMLNLVD